MNQIDKDTGEVLTDAEAGGIIPFSGMREELMPVGMESPAGLVASGQALQQAKTDYVTAVAVQRPRSFTRFLNNVEEEAGLAGGEFYFSWTQAGQLIEGGSIDLAMSMLRNYGNAALDTRVQETMSHYIFDAIFIDLESGTTLNRPFRQRKGQKVSRRMDTDRQEDIVFQIGISKAQRNVIFNALPKWVQKKMVSVAKAAEVASIKPTNIAEARSKVVSFMWTYGVDLERIEAKVGRPADKWNAEDIAELRGNATALKEGAVSADELFPETTTAEPSPSKSPSASDANPVNANQEIVDTFWKLRESGFKSQFESFCNAYEGWPSEVQVKFDQKCQRMAREHPESGFVPPWKKAPEKSEVVTPPPPLEEEESQDTGENSASKEQDKGEFKVAGIFQVDEVLRKVRTLGYKESQFLEYALSLGMALPADPEKERHSPRYELGFIDGFKDRWEEEIRQFEDAIAS